MVMIWQRSAPTSFMMPIWLICWVMSAVMVLTTKKAESSRITQPKVERINTAVLTMDSMMDSPTIVVPAMVRPVLSNCFSTTSVTARTACRVGLFSWRRSRRSL